MVYITAALAWLGFMAVMALFQTFGAAVLDQLIGSEISHSLITVLICLNIMAMITGFVRWAGRLLLGQLFILGLAWAVMSLTLELGVGHFAMGKDWPALMAGYDVFEGRLWPMVPLTMLLWPMAAGRLQMR